MHKSSMIRKYRLYLLVIIMIAIAVTAFMLVKELNHVTEKRAEAYADLHSRELATLFSSYLSRDITLAQNTAASAQIKAWLKDEFNQEVKSQALDTLSVFNQSSKDQKMFVAFDTSSNVYYFNTETTLAKINIESRMSHDDYWYQEVIDSPHPYTLYLEREPLSTAVTLWINVKIIQNGAFLGVVGTGINMDNFNEDTAFFTNPETATALIIDASGDIKIDTDNGIKLTNMTLQHYVSNESFHERLANALNAPISNTVLSIENSVYSHAGISPIKGSNWSVISLIKGQAFYEMERYGLIFFYILTILLVLVIAIHISIHHIFIKPFDALINSLNQNSAAHSLKIYGLDRNDEFGQLATSIEALSNRLVSSVPVGLFLLNDKGDLIYGNDYFVKQFGLNTTGEMVTFYGKNLHDIFSDSADYTQFSNYIKNQLALGVMEAKLKRIDQQVFWAEIHLTQTDRDGFSGFEGILLNIQLKKEYESELINQATVDPLTQLYNRRYFDETVKKEINRSTRHHHPLSMILFDLDHFKTINDTFGHIVGDEILSNITDVASNCLRETDTIARWGGEEFSILLPETDLQGAYHVAEKIRQAIMTYKHPTVTRITASFGIAQYRMDESYITWFERVDRYLYYAKENGRNQIYGLKRDYKSIDQLIQLKWHDSFSSGNTIIDEQHKELFKIANSIISNTMKINSESANRHAIKAFFEFVKKHFEDEEYILKDVGYPEEDLLKHKKDHDALLSKIKTKYTKENLTHSEVMQIAMMLIQEVVYEHMIQEDAKYFDYTRKTTDLPD